MKFNLFSKNIDVSIIACGDIGEKVGEKMIHTIQEGGEINVKSLAINSKHSNSGREVYSRRIQITKNQAGFARNLSMAYEAALENAEEIERELSKLFGKKEGITLIITGGGGTGTASTLLVSQILKTKFNKIPPILVVLPMEFESSRVYFNISTLIFELSGSDTATRNNLILIHNDPPSEINTLPFSETVDYNLDSTVIGLTNLFVSGFQEAVRPDFEAGYQDLLEVLFTPGISVITYKELKESISGETNFRYKDMVVESVIEQTNLPEELILKSKKVFCSIFKEGFKNIDYSYEATRFRDSFLEKPFLKYIKLDSVKEYKTIGKPSLNAILAGLPFSPKVMEIMQIARDVRKKVILKEEQIKNTVLDFNLERTERLQQDLEQIKTRS